MAVQQLQHTHGTTVVPSDTLYLFQSLGYPYRVSSALFVGVGGSVRVLTEGGDDVVFSSVPDGTFMPVHVVKVFATGTTASSIVAVDLSNLSPFIGLLDAYSGAAAAYSLRQLSSSYSGSAIRVRRSSDNTEQDIGFTSNELDVTALASFCSGTNGFVTTWYDQSGNGYNATQTTAANQPKVYDSSTGVITENGKAAVQFDGVNDGLFDSTLSQTSSNISIISALTMGTTGQPFGAQDATQGIRTYQGSAGNFRWECRGTSFGTLTFQENSVGGHKLKTGIFTPTSQNFYSDSISATSATNASSDYQLRPVQLGARYNVSTFFDGKLQEILFYPSDQSSNRTGIETNINDFYSIY